MISSAYMVTTKCNIELTYVFDSSGEFKSPERLAYHTLFQSICVPSHNFLEITEYIVFL